RLSDKEIIVAPPSWFPDSRHAVVAVKHSDDTRSELSIVDITNGSWRSILSAPGSFGNPSVSPDGKRIAFWGGQVGWDVLEISIPGGAFRRLVSGGVSRAPDWAPAG